MAINPLQREKRRGYIGSSDAAAIMGLDPYRSAADVWIEKTGRVNDAKETEVMQRGNFLEPGLVDFAEQTIGFALYRDIMLVKGISAANFDAIEAVKPLEPTFIVEAKSSGLADGWGAPGTDEVPDRVIIQTHHAMRVAGEQCRVAWIPVVLPGFRSLTIEMYRVDRSDTLADAIADECEKFWNSYVVTDIQPADFKPSLEILKWAKRVPSKVVGVADELVDALIIAKAAKKQAIEMEEEAQRSLLAAMADADGAQYSKGVVTYMETKRAGYTVDATVFRSIKIKPTKEKP